MSRDQKTLLGWTGLGVSMLGAPLMWAIKASAGMKSVPTAIGLPIVVAQVVGVGLGIWWVLRPLWKSLR